MNYFITGAGGFIGSSLAKKLAENGDKVYALLYSENEKIRFNNEKNVILLVRDLNDYIEIADSISNKIDCFIHLAWQGISSCDHKNVEIQKNNYALSINAAMLAVYLKSKRFVFCGSNQEYLVAKNKIDNIESSSSVYGTCKLCSRIMCQTLCKDEMIFCSTAFSSVFGVGDTSKRATNIFLSKLIKNQPLDLIKGDNLYDWTYISDAVDGLISVSKCGINGKQYYIGSRKLRTFKEIITNVRDILSPQTVLNFGNTNSRSSYRQDPISSGDTFDDISS